METDVVAFTKQHAGASVPVVGEATFQAALERFSGARDEEGVAFRHHAAVLVAQPQNRFDHSAVAVFMCDELGESEQVGYLSPDDAVAYAPILDLVSPAVPMCVATIEGGMDTNGEPGLLRIELALGSPAEMASEWLSEQGRARQDHTWVGQTVAFVGHSRYTIGGIRLDLEAQRLLAEQAGCRTEPHVTPRTQVVVTGAPVADPVELNAAASYGSAIVAEERFWTALGYRLQRVDG
jgi:hypothetical protein